MNLGNFLVPRASGYWDDRQMLRMLKAVRRNEPAGVAKAVASGADPNRPGRDGITPLMYSMFFPDNLAGIGALLEAGADPNYRNDRDPTAMGQAARYRDSGLLRLLLAHGGDPNLLNDSRPLTFTATYSERFENVFLLLQSGADVNAQTPISEQTLLLLMTALGFWGPALEVLDLGGDPLLPDGHGTEMARLLADHHTRWGEPPKAAEYAEYRQACADRGVPLS